MINWYQFEQELINFYNNYNNSRRQSVKKLITLYDNCIKQQGTDQFGNKVITTNKQALINILDNTFSIAEKITKGSAKNLIQTAWKQGIIAYWTNAQLQTNKFAIAGGISGISNTILSPGVLSINWPNNNTNLKIVAKAIRIALQNHCKSITGTFIIIISTPTGPIPMTVPWISVK